MATNQDANRLRKKRRGEQVLFELNTKLEDQGVDPITELAKMSKDANIDVKIRTDILRDLANYQYPKRRSIDVGNADDEGFVVRVRKYTDADLAQEKLTAEGKKELINDGKEET